MCKPYALNNLSPELRALAICHHYTTTTTINKIAGLKAMRLEIVIVVQEIRLSESPNRAGSLRRF